MAVDFSPRATLNPGSSLPSIAAGDTVANVITLIFAVTLCLVNAAVWTLVSDMPVMGIAWVAAAFACIFLQKWTRG